MSSTCDNFDLNPDYRANLETFNNTSRSFIPSSHRRVHSGDIAGAGDQFRPPRPQTSWPRHVEIAPEDLEPQHSAAGDLAVEITSIARPGSRRDGPYRSGSRSTSSIQSQHYTEADVAEFVTQRDRPQQGAARTDQSSASSYSSMTYESPTMSEDEYVFNAHTPTQNRPHLINGSRASTAPPGSVASTADRRGSLQEWPASPTPWCSLKRKRTESTDRNDTQLEVHGK